MNINLVLGKSVYKYIPLKNTIDEYKCSICLRIIVNLRFVGYAFLKLHKDFKGIIKENVLLKVLFKIALK